MKLQFVFPTPGAQVEDAQGSSRLTDDKAMQLQRFAQGEITHYARRR
jgi:hypothetical protein